jgi:hypothetical protein
MAMKDYSLQAVDVQLNPTILWRFPRRMLKQACVWLTGPGNLLFLALIVVHLIPIWAFKYFPSQDGPAHLANANLIREYDQPDRTAFRAYYVLNKNLTPNWFGHLVLAGLLSLIPMLVAEKVFLSGYVILLPISVRYAVSAVRPDSAFLAVLAFPFVYNYLFHMGFYSFSYGLPMFFFFSGYWLKHRDWFTFYKTIILAVLSLLLYFSHIVTMAAAFLALTLMTMRLILLKCLEQARKRQFSPHVLRNALPMLRPLYALVPTIGLFAIFFFQTRRYSLPISWEDKPPPRILLNQFLSLYSLVSYEGREIWISRAVACLFVAVIVYLLLSKKLLVRPNFWNGFVLVAAAYAFIYFIGPSEIGGGAYIHDRMNLYPFLVLIIWFAAHSFGPIARRFIPVLAIGFAVILLGLHSIKYVELNDYLDEYLSGMRRIEPNTTLLPIYFSQQGNTTDRQPLSLRVNFLLNAAGYVAMERRIIDLGNYEAGQTSCFPTLFRPDLNPAVQLHYAPLDSAAGELRALPTEILSYPQRTGGRIDYILVWGVRDQDYNKEIPKSIFRQLQEGYDLIYTSPQRGLMQLYHRKDMQIRS